MQLTENTTSILLDSVSEQSIYSETVKRRSYQVREVVEMLKKKQGDRTLRQFAGDLGISPAYLSDIYRGNRRPGKAVLAELGLAVQPPSEPVYVGS